MRPLQLRCLSALLVLLGSLLWAPPARTDDNQAHKEQASKMRDVMTLHEALGLVSVSDVVAETAVGYLPRLPRWIDGVYRDSLQGPPVPVIWPSPLDNGQVLETGTYTVTGTVAGTEFRPKAIVTVKADPDTKSLATRRLEPFSLGEVVLEPDDQGRDTPFIRNRDKFACSRSS